MIIDSNSRSFFAGKTGSGKTMFIKKALWPLFPRRIFWDIKLQNNDLLVNASLCRTPDELNTAIRQGKVSILYQPKDTSGEDFNNVCEIVYRHGNFTLIVDEVSAVCSPGWIEPWHRDLLMRGRSLGIGMINATQRPRAIHNTVLSEAEHSFIFRLKLETDIDKMKNILTREYRDMLPTLPYYSCIYSNDREVVKLLAPIRI